MKFKLRFPEKRIAYWADRAPDLARLQSIGQSARSRGYLTKNEFMKLCNVKSFRSTSLCEKNLPELVKEVTTISFSAKSEQVEIQSLTILTGVSWPTASYILHFCSKRHYPIIDYRALWSLSIDDVPSYTFDFWKKYTDYCRVLAEHNGISMRRLDSALWQYSKDNQL
ncbi:hypothetical protein [Propionivibrio sp.]|uniref:hypothetical protein n=1 Tax=Propionivibrio sp. TaxID=2212460 RepID=UPI0039E54350